jgi:hypothetical protein
MFALLDNVARRLVRRGVRRGLLEGSTAWVGIGAVALLVRLLIRPETPRVVREELSLGETIIVSHVAPPPQSRRQRRRADTTG